MTKKVPFVPNTPDNMHCVQSTFRMLYQYYFDSDVTWEELDKTMKIVPKKGTWTITGLIELAKKGVDILNIEPVDYQKLYKEGPAYLKKVVGEETVNYYLENSNIEAVIPDIPEFLEYVNHETRKASLEEILNYLRNGSLIGVEVNQKILNNKSGFNLHYVLLYDFDGQHIVLHDPGLPPLEGRKVALDEFERAFNYQGANGGITVFNNT